MATNSNPIIKNKTKKTKPMPNYTPMPKRETMPRKSTRGAVPAVRIGNTPRKKRGL